MWAVTTRSASVRTGVKVVVTRAVLGVIGGVVLGVIAGSLTFWWMQRRLEAFGELLTVVLGYRRLTALGDTVTAPRAPRDRGAWRPPAASPRGQARDDSLAHIDAAEGDPHMHDDQN